MNIRDEMLSLIDCLNMADLPYALCGGLAVALHGYVRATKDIDLMVPAAYVPVVVQAVKSVGFRVVNPHPMIFGAGTVREATVHRVSKFEGEEHMVLDILEVNSSNRPAWKGRRAYAFEGRKIWAITKPALIAMKKNAGRPKDLIDIEGLEGRLEW
jgi:hypothetical protein